MTDEYGSLSIAFAVRKGTGLSLSEFRSDRNLLAIVIGGLTNDGQLLAIL